MASGKYIIYQGGKVISESNNIITNEGMNIIRSYLCGTISAWAGAIAIGTMNSTNPSATDTSLDYEVSRVPVTIISIEGNEIIVRASVAAEFSAKIYELGIYPAITNSTSLGFDDRLILSFDEVFLNSSDGLPASSSLFTESTRIGGSALIFNTSARDLYVEKVINLTGYSGLDSFSLLYKTHSIGNNRNVTITLYDNQLPTPGTSQVVMSLDGSALGYKKVTQLFGNFVNTNNFNGQVVKIGVSGSSASGAGTFYLDAFKVNDSDETNPNFALVSRSLIGTQNGDTSTDYVVKPAGVEVDIEYRLDIS